MNRSAAHIPAEVRTPTRPRSAPAVLPAALLVIGMAVPIDIGALASVDLPVSLADLTAVGLFVLLVRRIPRDWVSSALLAFVFLSLLIASFQVAVSSDVRPLLSLARFCIVYLSFFVGHAMLRTADELKRFVLRATLVFSCVLVTIYVLVPLTDLRDPIELFGVPIFATDGVNAFAVYVALMGMLLAAVLLSDWGPRSSRWAIPLAAACLLYPFAVVSRQAMLAVALFVVVIVVRKIFERDWRATLIMLSLGAAVAVALTRLVDVSAVIDLLDVKLEDTSQILGGDLSTATSGRSDIADIMTERLLASGSDLLFGTRFSGFETRYAIDDEFGQGTSPHNQYLGTIFKAGLVAGIFYFVFLLGCLVLFVRFSRMDRVFGFYLGVIALICFGVLMVTQDFLTASLSGNVFMVICGSLRAITAEVPDGEVRPR